MNDAQSAFLVAMGPHQFPFSSSVAMIASTQQPPFPSIPILCKELYYGELVREMRNEERVWCECDTSLKSKV